MKELTKQLEPITNYNRKNVMGWSCGYAAAAVALAWVLLSLTGVSSVPSTAAAAAAATWTSLDHFCCSLGADFSSEFCST
jgi:hypothetical protein